MIQARAGCQSSIEFAPFPSPIQQGVPWREFYGDPPGRAVAPPWPPDRRVAFPAPVPCDATGVFAKVVSRGAWGGLLGRERDASLCHPSSHPSWCLRECEHAKSILSDVFGIME
jgi:hypothetical protein